MSRRKSETVPVPANRAEAELMIAEYTALERDRLLEELAAEEAIAQIRDARAERLRELDAEARPLFEGIKAWWEAGGKAEVAKGRRSTELGSAKIGVRLTPPAVKFARKVKAQDVVDWLRGLRWTGAKNFLRTKVSLDKEAVIKAVRADAKIAETFARFLTVDQTDEFFIETGLEPEAVKKELAAS